MASRAARSILTALTLAFVPAMACGQSTPQPSESSAPRPGSGQATPAQAKKAVVACDLLTKEEIQTAAGWAVAQTAPTHNPGPPALSICNFMGQDLTRVITVWYGEGSGGRYKTSTEMAKALGTRDGMLVKPAQPLDDLGIPATREDQRGGLVHVHGITSSSDELTVAASSLDVARALFVKALPRLTTPRP